jgi:hypothetical protein
MLFVNQKMFVEMIQVIITASYYMKWDDRRIAAGNFTRDGTAFVVPARLSMAPQQP